MFFTDEEKKAVDEVIAECKDLDEPIIVDYMRAKPVLRAMEKQRKWQFRDLVDYITDAITEDP